MSSLRRSTRIAAINTAKIVAPSAGKSDVEIVQTLLKAAESPILAENAVAVQAVMEYLLKNQTLWQTQERFQQALFNKACELMNSPHIEAIALESQKIREVSKKIAQAIINYRLSKAISGKR